MSAGSAISQQMSPGGSIWLRRCVTDNAAITIDTMQQSTVRRQRSMELRSRSMSTPAQRLSQAGCCVRAVVDGVMVDVLSVVGRRFFFGRRREVSGDRRRMRRLNCGEESATNLLGYFTEVRRLVTSP